VARRCRRSPGALQPESTLRQRLCAAFHSSAAALCALACVGALGADGSAANPAQRRLPTLHVYTWENYLDPQIAADFGERHGVRLRQSYFASDRERDLRLAAGGAADFDVVLLDAPQVSAYRKRGLIVPIGVERVPNLARIDPAWRTYSAATATHAVPFAWGTVGIAYRADLVARAPQSWLDLFRPDAALCGHVSAFDDARELVATALKAGGHSANATDAPAYGDAEALLRDQRHCVAEYGTLIGDLGAAAHPEILVAMSYSSDAAQLAQNMPNVRFVMPREGGLIWADYLVVPTASRHQALAFEFLSYLSDPQVAARQARYNRTAPASSQARALLPAALRQDPTMYPSGPGLRASEMIREAAPAVVMRRNLLYARLMRPD
jgi:spermidine/putrescine transport system substrate-binding protein